MWWDARLEGRKGGDSLRYELTPVCGTPDALQLITATFRPTRSPRSSSTTARGTIATRSGQFFSAALTPNGFQTEINVFPRFIAWKLSGQAPQDAGLRAAAQSRLGGSALYGGYAGVQGAPPDAERHLDVVSSHLLGGSLWDQGPNGDRPVAE